jgi:hypothetical protein
MSEKIPEILRSVPTEEVATLPRPSTSSIIRALDAGKAEQNRKSGRLSEPCGNPDCDKCYPLPTWEVSQHRIQHITRSRRIKAATPEEALSLFEAGTAWPSSYNERGGKIVSEDAPVVEQLSTEKKYGYTCYHNLNLPSLDYETSDDNFDED